jgi:hypothetical protein
MFNIFLWLVVHFFGYMREKRKKNKAPVTIPGKTLHPAHQREEV